MLVHRTMSWPCLPSAMENVSGNPDQLPFLRMGKIPKFLLPHRWHFRHHRRDKTPLTNRRENFTVLMLLSPSTWRLPSSPRLSAPVRQSSVTSLICSHCSWNPWLLVPSATAMESRPFSSSWRWYFKGLKDLAVKLGERQVWHSSSDT